MADDPSGIVQQMTEVGPRGPVPDDVLHHGAWQMADDLEGWFPSHNMARYADMMRDLAFDLRNARATEADLRAEVERLTRQLAQANAVGRAKGWEEAAAFLEGAKGVNHDGSEYDLSTSEFAAFALIGVRSFADAIAALSPETDGGQDAPADSQS